MSQKRPLYSLTVVPTVDIPAYRAVGYDDEIVAAEGAKVQGVSATAIPAGKAGAIDVAGTTLIEAGAAFDKGDSLIAGDDGRAIPASALALAAGATAVTANAASPTLEGADLPTFVFADALEAASAAGAIVEVKLR